MRSLCLMSLAVLILIVPATAQQGATELRGVVLDAQQAVLPGVSLTIRNRDTGTFRETVSNPDGTYFVTGLIPGVYEVRASLSGFREHVHQDVRLEVGKTTTVDVTLEVGRLEEAVTVTAETPLIDVTSKEIGGHITGRELVELPSVNRNFIGFVGLLPGVVPNISTESFGSDNVVVNGTDSRNNNFLVDGANNNDDVIGQRAGTQARTPIEAIQEFQVLTHQFDAEFGRTTGAVINAITKQGTNRFTGSAFSFFQDAALTEKDFFAKQNNLAKPETKQTQWGGTVGGPVVRDKAHFFFSLERVMIDRGTTVNIPARPEFNTAATTQDRVWNTIVRFDNQLNANHTWGVRWLRESSPQRNQLIPVLGRQSTTNASREESDVDQTTVGTLTSVMGNSRLNTVRFAFTRENVAFANPGFNGNGRSQIDLEPTLQYLTFIDQQSEVASARINNAFSIDDTYSWFIPGKRGDHDLKFGIQYQYSTNDSTDQGFMNGLFAFRGNDNFNPADPRTYPERLQIRVPGPLAFYMKSHFGSAFVQDKWKLTDRLTLTLGMRYDIEVVPLQELDNPKFSDPGAYPVDKNNFAPRIGFAWSPGDHRSVVRGGYGLFYDKTHFELITNIITGGVYSDSFVTLVPANAADPGPSLGQLPNDPLLRGGPVVNRTLLDQLYPPGSRLRNTGTVVLDDPTRRIPYTSQLSIGYERQLGATASASVDFVHAFARDLFMSREVNPGTRVDTSRTGQVIRANPAFVASVLERSNLGKTDYDALEMQLEKRFAGNYSARVAYTLSYSRGNTSANFIPQSLVQIGDDLRLDANEGPTDFDRRHNLVFSGTALVPKTGGLTVSAVARALSGLPFSLIDSNTDPDRNGILFDFLPAGTYSGTGRNAITVENYNGKRNGAYGPGFFQLDLRLGYRINIPGGRRLDAFAEIFNLTDHANFNNPVVQVLAHPGADRRLTDFLTLTTLRPGGIPRTGQIGLRLAF